MAHRGEHRLSVVRARPVRHRRALARALAATGLAALATWPLVIASPVSGASCIFKGGEVFVRAGDESVVVQQNGVAKTILANGLECTPTAPIAETTSIRVTGGTRVEIDLFDTTGATIDWGSIDWSLELGFSVPSELVLDNEGGDGGIEVTAGTTGIDLNSDGDLDATYAGVGVLSVIGGPGSDVISGSGDAVTGEPVPQEMHLTGGLGADRLSGGREDDRLDCGLDVDWVDFSASPVAEQVDLANGTATGLGADAVVECENVAGSTLSDTLFGDAENNVFAPGVGDDTVDGAEGADTVDYGDATAAVTVDLLGQTATGGSGTDTLANVENAVGSGFGDSITGNGVVNRLVGGAGPDTVAGGDGDDTLDGGTEIDRLIGGLGLDTCILDTVERSCDPSIVADPGTIEAGGDLHVTGGGWYPENGSVDVRLLAPDGTSSLLTTLTPDETWSIDDRVTAPADEGTYTVEACQPCSDSAERPQQELLVQPVGGGPAATRTLVLSQTDAQPGDRIHVLGTGWNPEDGKVKIYLDRASSTGKPDARKLPAPNGDVDIRLDVPDLEAGSYPILACQRCNGPGRIAETTTLTIPGASPTWLVIALVAGLAAIAGLVVSRIRGRRPTPTPSVAAHLRRDVPDVVVIPEPDERPRHTVRLIPRPDPGVQEVRERSST